MNQRPQAIPGESDLLQQMLTAVGVPLCALNRQGEIMYANAALAALLACAPEELAGTRLADRLPSARAPHPLTAALDNRQPLSATRTRVSAEVTLEYHFSPIELPTGPPIAGVVTFSDVSGHAALEHTLWDTVQQLDATQALAAIGSWTWRPERDLMTWTVGLTTLLGMAATTLPALTTLIAQFDADDRPQIMAEIARAVQDEAPFAFDARLPQPDGQTRIIEIHGNCSRTIDGELSVRATMRDVTARVQSQQALARSRERFQTVFEEAGIGIVLLNRDGTIGRSNAAWQALIGVDETQLTGQPFAKWLDTGNQQLMDDLLARLDQKPGTASPLRAELCGQTAAGAPVWINLTITQPAAVSDQPEQLIVLVEDVSEQHAIEVELSEVKRRLTRSRESERLRLAQELHDGPMQDLYAAQYQMQKLRRRLGDRADLIAIADDIVDTYRQVNTTLRAICGELRPPSLVPFGLATAIRAHAELFQERYPALAIALDLMPDGQQLSEYDRLTLFRILQETLNNVARHALAKNILINLTFDDDAVVLEVHDDGVGFEVPERWIDLARADHLGLVGAAERVEAIDGRIVVVSAPGSGTIVRVTAPLKPVEYRY